MHFTVKRIKMAIMSEGDAAIVAVAQTQIGNECGLKYCEWYGYFYEIFDKNTVKICIIWQNCYNYD